MPFLRVIRDKRGYETTYLMHWFRDGNNRQRSKVLYVFRTPGGVRVGRDPFDPEIVRELEARHPEIDFEWKIIRDNQQIIEPAPEQRRRRPKSEAPEAVIAPPAAPVPATSASAPAEAVERQKPVPSGITGATADEQIAFLGEWYPEIRERIDKRVSDPARREALHALTERLNPATWTDADQITTGLQQAGEALERLSHVFARRRRRGRRRTSTEQPTAPPSSEPS